MSETQNFYCVAAKAYDPSNLSAGGVAYMNHVLAADDETARSWFMNQLHGQLPNRAIDGAGSLLITPEVMIVALTSMGYRVEKVAPLPEADDEMKGVDVPANRKTRRAAAAKANKPVRRIATEA